MFSFTESALLQVRGINGKILNAMNPLEPIASKDEILATENHILETFYPIAPTIDLQEVYTYETKDDTGKVYGDCLISVKICSFCHNFLMNKV